MTTNSDALTERPFMLVNCSNTFLTGGTAYQLSNLCLQANMYSVDSVCFRMATRNKWLQSDGVPRGNRFSTSVWLSAAAVTHLRGDCNITSY